MTRKLELADISMYLPYGLKAIINDFDIAVIKEVTVYGKVGFNRDVGYDRWDIGFFKPILRPMSDLTKPMTHPDINGGEEFIPLLWITKDLHPTYDLEYDEELKKVRIYKEVKTYGKYSRMCVDKYSIRRLFPSHKEICSLVKLHFDYNDLIGQGLAIDINTLKK